MSLTFDKLQKIGKEYGASFYLLDSSQFTTNYFELQKAFSDIYPNSHIAYSYKTNYIPKLCKIVNDNGGFAEIVSEMEYKIAISVGVKPDNIYFNGPYKNKEAIKDLLLSGGIVNIDSDYEVEILKNIATEYPDKQLAVGIRCNFDIKDGVVSRFGYDINGEAFTETVKEIRKIKNINLAGFHCHFASRNILTWPDRAKGMLKLVERYFEEPPAFISLGGGLFGKMPESLEAQFNTKIPTYDEYANSVATYFRDFYRYTDEARWPKLIIEPGSALAGDVMKFVAKVINIKDVRGKKIATLAGSIYNINPTLNKKNLPVTVYHQEGASNKQQNYMDIDFGGYTCIESDYLYRGFNGNLAVNDYVVFDNVGSYSIVLKPPFILPNFAIIDYNEKDNSIELIKHEESFEDLFRTFEF